MVSNRATHHISTNTPTVKKILQEFESNARKAWNVMKEILGKTNTKYSVLSTKITSRFRQSSIIFEKSGYFSENLKLWRSPTTIEFNIFCLNFAHISYLSLSSKGFSGFLIFFRPCTIKCKKPGFSECLETRSFLIFASNSRLKQ